MKAISTLIYSNRLGIRILRHSLFWITDLINHLIVVVGNNGSIPLSFYVFLFKLPLIVLATYYVLYYLLPLSNKPESRGKVIAGVVGVIFFIGVVVRYYKFYLVAPLIDPGHEVITEVWGFARIISEIFASMVLVCMAITIKLLKNKTELQQRNEQLETEKKLAELNFLKAQMQPHFLFNTLNTLYSETIQDSGKAQQVVLHLSNLLRFILDECNKSYIPVSHEIKVIRNFVELEKLRHGSRLQVDLKIDEIDETSLVSPLIFLPFVENSFKHTLSNNRGPIQISIAVGMKGNHLSLFVENNHINGASTTKGHPSGKGTVNTRRQLDLLYGNDYNLTVNDGSGTYQVTLTIPVKSSTSHG